ncbi:hypothetical protein DL95DRAFT_393209, partial [Leptodontidium sp. 2 PMI_412]
MLLPFPSRYALSRTTSQHLTADEAKTLTSFPIHRSPSTSHLPLQAFQHDCRKPANIHRPLSFLLA